jgi:predicted  nucleic acid-binding Zn-ribbon protein
MKTRHRIPTIFNLYMVDVLCCALGCVILLWLLNLRDARHQAGTAEETAVLLAQTRAHLDEAGRETARAQERLQAAEEQKRQVGVLLAAVQEERDRARKELEAARAQAADLTRRVAALREESGAAAQNLERKGKDLEQARSRIADLDKALAALRADQTAATESLVKKTNDLNDLAKKLLSAEQQAANLADLLGQKESLAKAAARRGEDLSKELAQAEARMKQLQALAELVPGLRDKSAKEEARAGELEKELARRLQELADAGKDFQGLEDKNRKLGQDVQALTTDLAAARRALEALRLDKDALATAASQARAALDHRFAGISLTGRRVLFLVDTSGSMDLVDERTPAPAKWEGVSATLTKIMSSLPSLEKFQVILFAENAWFPLGTGDRWLDYDRATSLNQVSQALTRVKPRGNTNMYAALEAAFRFRISGLDTIYLLSDGLPNVGPGLTPAETSRTLKDTERAELLAKHVRRTLKTTWNRDAQGLPRVRINTIGFFYESPDVGAFLWALARENEGSFVGMSQP